MPKTLSITPGLCTEYWMNQRFSPDPVSVLEELTVGISQKTSLPKSYYHWEEHRQQNGSRALSQTKFFHLHFPNDP